MANNDVAYMFKYFQTAIEMEKNLFVLRGSMDKANQEMRAIYREKTRMEQEKNASRNNLTHLDQKYLDEADSYKQDRRQLARWRTVRNIFMVLLVPVGLVFLISFIAMMVNYQSGGGSAADVLFVVFLYLSAPCIVFTAVGSARIKKLKKRLAEGKNRDLKGEQSIEAQVLAMAMEDNDARIAELKESERSLTESQDIISKSYQNVSQALRRFYGLNVIAPKYQNFVALTSFCEYLTTQRCVTIIGPNGVIDTFEKDRKVDILLQTMKEIRDIVADTNVKTAYLCKQAQAANAQLSEINSSLSAIKLNTGITAANTAAIASYCSSINESVHRIEYSYF